MTSLKPEILLPIGWRWFDLQELVTQPKLDIVDGPFGSNLKASEYTEEGVPILRLQNVESNRFIQKNIKFVCLAKAAELRRHSFQAGDLIVTKLGDPLGEACIVPENLGAGLIVADLVRVRVNLSRALREAVCYAINSPFVQRQFEDQTKGTTRPRINLSHVRQVRLSLPEDLSDQRALVAEIEKQFTRLDAGVASLKRMQAALKRYRASVLMAACEGRLVPTEAELARKEGRSYETGEQLLARTFQERWRNSARKEFTTPSTQVLLPLPTGWTWATPDQLAVPKSNAICAGPFGTIFKAKDFRPKGVPIIFLRHVGPGRYLTHKPNFMDDKKWNELFQPYSVYGGELLITKLGDPPGVCAVYPTNIGAAMVTPDVIKMSVDEATATPRFLMHYFNSELARRITTDVAFGTTRLRLTLPLFRRMPIPLPPVVEQHRIVAEVERRLSVIEQLEAVVGTNLKRAERLRQSILQRAFTGQL